MCGHSWVDLSEFNVVLIDENGLIEWTVQVGHLTDNIICHALSKTEG